MIRAEDVTSVTFMLKAFCSFCKKELGIRPEFWPLADLVVFQAKTGGMPVSHGVCPECKAREYGEK